MNTKFFRTLLLIVGLLVLAIIGYLYVVAENGSANSRVANEEKEVPFTPEGKLAFFDAKSGDTITEITIEVADTELKRAQGLMYRSQLADTTGMLFIFDQHKKQSFFMKNTRISLDIIFVASNLEVVSMQKYAIPYDETSIPSGAPAKYVVEVIGGFSDRYSIEKGDYIDFTLNSEN